MYVAEVDLQKISEMNRKILKIGEIIRKVIKNVHI